MITAHCRLRQRTLAVLQHLADCVACSHGVLGRGARVKRTLNLILHRSKLIFGSNVEVMLTAKAGSALDYLDPEVRR